MSGVTNHGILSEANNVLISGGTFTETTQPTTEWIKLLQSHTSTGAFHDSDDQYDAPRCHPHTRELVRKEIMDWVQKVDRIERFLWIYGPAGSGKSSIARTIAESCKALGILASDFFFSGTVAGRNTHTNLIPTLACQHTTSIPDIRIHIAEAINSDALIFSRSLQIQLETLILKPFAQLALSNGGSRETGGSNRVPYPYLIIIDGLDECGSPENQSYVLTSFSSAFEKLYTPFMCIIASRPDLAIRDAFNGNLNTRTRRIVLDDKYLPDEDIRLYLNSKFSEIKQNRTTLPVDWPNPSSIDTITQKASGQFIYASTVMKFIASRGILPTKALEIVLNLVSSSDDDLPFAELDALYTRIFLSLKKKTLDKALTAFAFIFVISNLWSFTTHGNTLKITLKLTEHCLGYDFGELSMVLEDLHSIVDVPLTPSGPLRLFHASLGDFLQDKSRSKELFIDTGEYCAKFATIFTDRLTPHLEGSLSQYRLSNIDQHICSFFLELFSTAHDDENLLRKLDDNHFPIKNFIQFIFSTADLMYVEERMLNHTQSLFKWIQRQDSGLYNVYLDHLDIYLKSRMLSDICHPQWQSILTALTLYDKVKFDGNTLNYLGGVFDGYSDFVSHLFSSSKPIFNLWNINLDFLFSRLSSALHTDTRLSTNELYFHVDTSSYIQLAVELFDFCTLPETIRLKLLRDGEQALVSELFLATLEKIPAEEKLGNFLRDNQNREYVKRMARYKSEHRSYVQRYIKACSLPKEAPPPASVEVPAPTNIHDTVPANVPSPTHLTKAIPTIPPKKRGRVRRFIKKVFD